LAARKSLDFIEDGMVVGLGTGSTATCLIKLLGERVQRDLKIRVARVSARMPHFLLIASISQRHHFDECR